MRTLEEISNEIVVKQKEVKIAMQNQYIIEDKIMHLQKDIISKQGEKKDLEIIAGKGKHNIRQINIDIKMLTAAFWDAKT